MTPAYELSREAWIRSGLSQLRMGFTAFDRLPEPPPLPASYGLRGFRDGDEDAWVSILSTGEFGPWDRSRLDAMLAGARAPLPRETIVFAVVDDRPIGCANGFVYRDERGEYGELGWVAVDPAHRGHGLAFAVCHRVLRRLGALGHRYVFLKTEDFRPAAIKTYLRLGFVPEVLDAGQHPRWDALCRLVGMPPSRAAMPDA